MCVGVGVRGGRGVRGSMDGCMHAFLDAWMDACMFDCISREKIGFLGSLNVIKVVLVLNSTNICYILHYIIDKIPYYMSVRGICYINSIVKMSLLTK